MRLRVHLDQSINTFSYLILGGEGPPPIPPLPVKFKPVVELLQTKDRPSSQPPVPAPTEKTKNLQLRPDSFQGLTTWEAAEKFLQVRGKPTTTTEIAVALTRQGFETSSGNFRGALYQALRKKPKIFVCPDKGVWGLKDWGTK